MKKENKIKVSFISIAFVVVKLKLFKVLRTNSASMLGPLWAAFAYFSSNIVLFCSRFTIGSFLAEENSVLTFFEKTERFIETGRTPLSTFGPTLHLIISCCTIHQTLPQL